MIDKDGNIRGKVNIVDIFILIVLLATVAFVGCRFLFQQDGTEEEDIETAESVIIKFTSTEVNDFTVEQLESGALVFDTYVSKELGSAVDFTVDDAVTYTVTDSGDAVVVSIPGMKSVEVTIEGTGELDEYGLLIDSTRYAVGHSTVVYVGKCMLSGKISGIGPVTEGGAS